MSTQTYRSVDSPPIVLKPTIDEKHDHRDDERDDDDPSIGAHVPSRGRPAPGTDREQIQVRERLAVDVPLWDVDEDV